MSRRVRGMLLRAAYTPRVALLIGVLLVIFASVLLWLDFAWESWATDGAALIAAATGVAFIVAAMQGRRPDWME
jgi:hypothetical protein